MPVINGYDTNGSFYQWGDHGHKYYYNPRDEEDRLLARSKAVMQGRAIKVSQNRATRKRGNILKIYMKHVT